MNKTFAFGITPAEPVFGGAADQTANVLGTKLKTSDQGKEQVVKAAIRRLWAEASENDFEARVWPEIWAEMNRTGTEAI